MNDNGLYLLGSAHGVPREVMWRRWHSMDRRESKMLSQLQHINPTACAAFAITGPLAEARTCMLCIRVKCGWVYRDWHKPSVDCCKIVAATKPTDDWSGSASSSRTQLHGCWDIMAVRSISLCLHDCRLGRVHRASSKSHKQCSGYRWCRMMSQTYCSTQDQIQQQKDDLYHRTMLWKCNCREHQETKGAKFQKSAKRDGRIPSNYAGCCNEEKGTGGSSSIYRYSKGVSERFWWWYFTSQTSSMKSSMKSVRKLGMQATNLRMRCGEHSARPGNYTRPSYRQVQVASRKIYPKLMLLAPFCRTCSRRGVPRWTLPRFAGCYISVFASTWKSSNSGTHPNYWHVHLTRIGSSHKLCNRVNTHKYTCRWIVELIWKCRQEGTCAIEESSAKWQCPQQASHHLVGSGPDAGTHESLAYFQYMSTTTWNI